MPFKSQQQRALFHAALNDPVLRKKLGISLSVIRKFLEEDEMEKLEFVNLGDCMEHDLKKKIDTSRVMLVSPLPSSWKSLEGVCKWTDVSNLGQEERDVFFTTYRSCLGSITAVKKGYVRQR